MAGGPETYTSHVLQKLVREIWPDENLIEEVIEEEPLLGMCAKETDWSYAVKHWPLLFGANQGIGRTFAEAKLYKSTGSSAEFQIATREMYAALSIEGKLLRAFEYTKKKALLVDPVTRAGENTIDRMRRRFSQAIHGNGVGVIGRIATGSTVGSATITLDNANDLKNFEPDRPIQVELTGATGGTVSTEVAYVASIGTEDSPTVTIKDAAGSSIFWNAAFTSVAVAVGTRIYGAGTYDNDFIYGLDAFLPLHTGTPGTFLTCNRNVNPGYLAGRCMTGTNMSVYQRIKKAARISVDAGNKPDVYLLSTRNFEKLEFEFDNKLQLQKFPAADVGNYKLGVKYGGVEVQGPRGPIKVLPSMWMPDSVERCGELSSIVMGSIGPLVHWDMGNGMGSMSAMRTEDGTDNREMRAVSDPAFLVKKPGAWVRVAV